jgi:hypothetical protein
MGNTEKIFSHGLNLRVVENSGGNRDWRSPVSREKLRELGFDLWLIDVLTGPDEVINTLCHSSSIHAVVCTIGDSADVAYRTKAN